MKKEYDEYLCKRYPEIFKNRHGDVKTTCMVFGFECGDGWFNLIDKTCEAIMSHVGDKIAPPVAVQVKEKFGTLRFYVDGGDATTNALIGLAEALSATTCEECGGLGRIRHGGWLLTLCDKHAKERGKEYKEPVAQEEQMVVGQHIYMLVAGGFVEGKVVDPEAKTAIAIESFFTDQRLKSYAGKKFKYEFKNTEQFSYYDAIEVVE